MTQLEATIDIDAPPATVWSLVTDLPRMAEWSPQVVRTFVRGGTVREGTTFLNLNRRKLLLWPTQAKVVRFTPHEDFAFRVKENYAVWSFRLEPTPTGTRVTQRREVPRGISKISTGLTTVALGGVPSFTGELEDGMRQTLGRIKAAAEAR
ncbi:SRPBCC family protein [Nocardioides sp. SYSU D00038]|uniref:SRPBCC family protein n=1 Tax=Nocardioides sp. SYSU D00038 TaxID=2812554 RepID=UPI001966F98E|nr:SRPBCC family protein [Nocardioides sp. SYSU D00038]